MSERRKSGAETRPGEDRMSFWTTPHGAGFRILNFLVRRLPPVRRLQMELDAAVEYHDYYAQSVDRALGQPRGYGDLRTNHVNEIARLRGKTTLTCRDCGAKAPLIAGLCAGCSDASEAEDDTANAQ